jgi:hypothetical protein
MLHCEISRLLVIKDVVCDGGTVQSVALKRHLNQVRILPEESSGQRSQTRLFTNVSLDSVMFDKPSM